jgi:DMSO reductase family type II enzyme heme b subunit
MKGGQDVAATGVHETGSYRVVFRRQLKARGDGNVALQAGSRHPVAFAVWDGSASDRDGMKSITIWQELVIGQ